MISRILYLAVPTYWLYKFMDWMLCGVDWWQVQTWQMLCGLKQYWPTWMSKRVTGTSGQKRWNTRYPKYPMILKKNRVRIGYCQKISGRVGYRVPVRPCLGPPKHVLHLVWSCLDTYLALKTTLKVSLYSYLNPANSGQIMTINTGNLFVFEVGPSVKFVSAIIDAIFNKKN